MKRGIGIMIQVRCDMRRLVIYILLITLMLASCSTDQTNNGEGHKTPVSSYPSSTPTHKETDNPVQTPSTEPPSDGMKLSMRVTIYYSI